MSIWESIGRALAADYIAGLERDAQALKAENARLKAQFLGYQLPPDRPDPSDIVPIDGIYHDGEGIVTVDLRKLNIILKSPPNVWIPEIPATGSMQPAFDWKHNNILIAGRDAGDQLLITRSVTVGDIVVARVPPDFDLPEEYYVIHRVVEISLDAEGLYYMLKGDYNSVGDGVKLRPENILYLSIGTIY